MKFVVESGSTKANWAMVDDAGSIVNTFDTMGFNPFFHNADFIGKQILKNEALSATAAIVNEVFFYGAGCSSDHYKQIVAHGLMKVFDKASIHVDHDLVAAAYATYQGKPCISCIIGTGSNSCYFDGTTLYEEVPALAYILGDEGSGSYFGKKVLADYLYKKLPKELEADFEEHYLLSKAIIFENVYQKPHANVYLASFSPFVSKHKNHPYIKPIILEGLTLFLQNHVCCYPQYADVQVHFVGSVAYHFSELLHEAATNLGITIGSIIKHPVEHLVQYHVKYVFLNQNV
ncbi:MAG: ATPase [Bacteroidia bacterium]|jgi:N-acetylglucosamine kinase-like BadF-type ATPase|nr:ATPase [Bacteroidia bacterium]